MESCLQNSKTTSFYHECRSFLLNFGEGLKSTALNFSDDIDQWSCNENESEEEQCIDKSSFCDGNKDCTNGKDEEDCPGVYKDYKFSSNYLILNTFFGNQKANGRKLKCY